MKSILISLASICFLSCTHSHIRISDSTPRKPSSTPDPIYEMVNFAPLNINLRAGYLLEPDQLKGCVLYLQGLGDSIKNHRPYFTHLQENGYRVMYFDYLGQGGSEGSMNSTRIKIADPKIKNKKVLARFAHNKNYEIPQQADFIWDHFKNVKNKSGQDCTKSKKFLIGWSTGGLSSYRMAFEKRADAVVLIAPGIHPKTLVGSAAEHPTDMFLYKQVITESTLTRQTFAPGSNPHLDPIKPTSPFHVPNFAVNLLATSIVSHAWKIDSNVPGLVFLSGEEDTYVNRDKTVETLRENANHFKVVKFDGALHELDNETSDVTRDLYSETIRFFDSIINR